MLNATAVRDAGDEGGVSGTSNEGGAAICDAELPASFCGDCVHAPVIKEKTIIATAPDVGRDVTWSGCGWRFDASSFADLLKASESLLVALGLCAPLLLDTGEVALINLDNALTPNMFPKNAIGTTSVRAVPARIVFHFRRKAELCKRNTNYSDITRISYYLA